MRKAVVILLIPLVLVGCATFGERKDVAYKSLLASATLYDNAMKIVAELDKSGLLTPDEKVVAVRSAYAFYTAWHSARLAVEIWMITEDSGAEDKAMFALKEAAKRWDELVAIIQPLLERGGYKWPIK